jgi:FlaA1/EpsC-like NDP-sugar epimerase
MTPVRHQSIRRTRRWNALFAPMGTPSDGRSWSIGRIVNGARRHAPAAAGDGLVVLLAFQFAVLLRFDGEIPRHVVTPLVVGLPLMVATFIVSNLLAGVYWRAWQYGGLIDVLALAQASALSVALALVTDVAIGFVSGTRPMPLSVVFVGSVLSLMGMAGVKLTPRILKSWPSEGGERRERLLVVGAGRAGQWLIRELVSNESSPYEPVCLVDDDPRKLRQRVHGVPVVGNRHEIADLVLRFEIDVVAIAIPSAPGAVIRELVGICQATGVAVRIVPGVQAILSGRAAAQPLREVTIDDLLGREQVEIDLAECHGYIGGRVVLITGAAGSIGSELARQVYRLGPSQVVLLDSNESGLHDLALRLGGDSGDGPATVLSVCSVERAEAVERVFARYEPHVIFHAAAYKHVPLMEAHPDEAVLVNVQGTLNVCRAAQRFGAERFVLISSDKAVRPANVMGATKRVCEEMVRGFGAGRPAAQGVRGNGRGTDRLRTVFCAVRFGNVLDSRGSVVPIFRWQIERGGPVTVTHPEMKRYFMTIPEAASLVIQAGAYARGGEVFLLDMGEEMNIADLAEKMILMQGLEPGVDVKIEFSGLRPGEKLREELVVEAELLEETAHPKISRVTSGKSTEPMVFLKGVEEACALARRGDLTALRRALFDLAAADPSNVPDWTESPKVIPLQRRSGGA